MEKAIVKKMRLQLFTKEFDMISDKLVAQDTEMYHGPAEPHEGPLKVEFCLFEREDVDQCVLYLQKLAKLIPIETKVKKMKKVEAGAVPQDELLARIKECETQDELIKFLRGEGFVFLSSEQAEDYELFAVPDEWEDYQWMLKLTREAKDPKNNKYDLTIKVGIKIIGDKSDKVIVYVFKEGELLDLPWKNPNKATNYRKLGMAKFPDYMVSEERMKFSKELAAYRREKEANALIPNAEDRSVFQPDSFTRGFKRWTPFVEFAEKEELMEIFK
jgi:hypothetical protein